MKFLQLIAFTFFPFILSAYAQVSDPNLVSKTNKQYEIEIVEKNKDTLNLVLMNRIIYYPFGKANEIKKLKNIDPDFVTSNISARDKYSGESIKLIKLSYKESYLKFYKS